MVYSENGIIDLILAHREPPKNKNVVKSYSIGTMGAKIVRNKDDKFDVYFTCNNRYWLDWVYGVKTYKSRKIAETKIARHLGLIK